MAQAIGWLLAGLPVLASATEPLPAPPEMTTLHYVKSSGFRHGSRTRLLQLTVDVDANRRRADLSWSNTDAGTQTNGRNVMIDVYDSSAGVLTSYSLDHRQRRGTVRRLQTTHPVPYTREFDDFYPATWQRTVEASRHEGLGPIVRAGEEVVGGRTVEVYEWFDPVLGSGYRWWMTREDGAWIPVQYRLLPVSAGPPERFHEVRINQPLEEALFQPPEGYDITDLDHTPAVPNAP